MSRKKPSALITEVIGSCSVIRFNRATERNPLSIATLEEINEAISNSAGAAKVSAVIFTGTEDVFASGADIRELNLLDPASAKSFSLLGQRLCQRIAELPQVTISAINGYCMGGALDLALACDCRVASTNAVFAHPGARLGIITGWGGTQRLAQLIGRSRALELFCTARRFSSTEALDIGLVTRVGNPVLDCAIQVAREMRRETGRA